MRNYVMFFGGTVSFSQVNPNPPPDFINPTEQHFMVGTLEQLNSDMAEFVSFLDPMFFGEISSNVFGKLYLELNKENTMELLGFPNLYWGLIGDIIVTESPRSTWSNGH